MSFDGIRCHDRIEKIADDAQSKAQRGNDEGKLTNLGHGEAAAHGTLQAFATQHERERTQNRLADNDGHDQHEDG